VHQNYSCTNWKGCEPECLIRLPGHFSDLSSPAASALNLCLAPFQRILISLGTRCPMVNHQKQQEQMVVEQTTRGNGIFHRCAMRVYISMYIYIYIYVCIYIYISTYGSKYLLRKYDCGMIWGLSPFSGRIWIHRVPFRCINHSPL